MMLAIFLVPVTLLWAGQPVLRRERQGLRTTLCMLCILCLQGAWLSLSKERTYPLIHDTYPLHWLTKSWTTDSETRAYFDTQRAILTKLVSAPPPTLDGIRISVAGDLMRMPSAQTHSVSKNVLDLLSRSDLVTANLETLISPRYPLPPDSLFMMNSHAEILDGFRRDDGTPSLSLVSLANNHIVDYPDDAIADTIAALEQRGIAHHGIASPGEAPPFRRLNIRDIRVGYYAATSFVNSRKKLAASQMQLTPMLDLRQDQAFVGWKSFPEIDLSSFQQALTAMQEAGIDLKIISLH
jgi:hypothetical protein